MRDSSKFSIELLPRLNYETAGGALVLDELGVGNGSLDGPTLFLEVDNNTLDKKALRIKITRFFQYYSSRKYKRDLESDRFPRVCVLAPSLTRLEVVKTAIVSAKEFHTGSPTDNVSHMPFWLATFD